MKYYLLFTMMSLSTISFGQYNVDFNDLMMPQDTFYNGSEGATTYNSGNVEFPVVYDTTWNYWSSGFAMSTMNDTTNGTFTNLYSSYDQSSSPNAYAVANLGEGKIKLKAPVVLDATFNWNSIKICNTTYAYKSMLEGDAFAKKFGGVTGDDPDFFFVRIYISGGGQQDSLDVYLADFRFGDNSKDYIVDDWTTVDLSSYPPNSQNISFKLFSSDTGAFGINTPLFFCLDDLSYDITVGTEELLVDHLSIRHDLSTGVWIDVVEHATYEIYSISGQLMDRFEKGVGPFLIQTDYSGMSIIRATGSNWIETEKVYFP